MWRAIYIYICYHDQVAFDTETGFVERILRKLQKVGKTDCPMSSYIANKNYLLASYKRTIKLIPFWHKPSRTHINDDTYQAI